MGNSEGSQESQSSNGDNGNRIKFLHGEIDKFYTTDLTKNQFIFQLFSSMQKQRSHSNSQLIVSNTYILQRLFVVVGKESDRKTVNCAKLKSFVQKMFKDADFAIQKSFALLDLDGDKCITNAEFLNYMDNCFISVLTAIEKDTNDHNFKLAFKEWVMKNKKIFFDFVLQIFQKYKRSDPKKWNLTDYKRWILSGENWTLDFQIGSKKYRMPLNLLCLFSIPSQ